MTKQNFPDDKTQGINAQKVIGEAIRTVDEMGPQSTDGRWLEDLTADVSPHIAQ